jgi:peptide chain release factor subunit 1
LREVLGQAQRNGRGAVGLRRVLRSLETGEVQALILGDKFEAPGVECPNCGHLDFHMGESCAVCGQSVRQLSDMADVLIGNAVRKGIELIYVEQNEELEKVGHIGALLRFRSDQNTPMKQAG